MKLKSRAILVAAIFVGLVVGCSSVSDLADQDLTELSPEDAAAQLQDEAQERVEDEIDDRTDGLQTEAKLRALVEAPHRGDGNSDRDEYRNPVDTLTFFGISPDYRVVELLPGTGWYTELLAPLVTRDGAYVAGAPHIAEDADEDDYQAQIAAQYMELLEMNAEVLGDISVATFSPGNKIDLGEAGSADMVVTFRNLHGLYNNETLDEALAAVNEVLAPGGVFGVVQHRAPEGSDPAETSPKGYLPQDFVIETIEAAGFVLEETSEVNANPMDTADHEDGVWALPPSLRGGEETAEQFLEIGESDRMTLRFVKPEAADVAADADADAAADADADADAEESEAESAETVQ